MMKKILRLPHLLILLLTLLTTSYASASDQAVSNSTEKTSTVKNIFSTIKAKVSAGNNKINIAVAKVSEMLKDAVKSIANKDELKTVPTPKLEERKTKFTTNIFPKNFTKKVSSVQSIAGKIMVAINSGDYNLIASIMKTTDPQLLGQAVSLAVSSDPTSSITIANSAYKNLPSGQSTSILKNMSSQLSKNPNNVKMAGQVDNIIQSSNTSQTSNTTTQTNSTPLTQQLAGNSSGQNSNFPRQFDQSAPPSFAPPSENPSIASPGAPDNYKD